MSRITINSNVAALNAQRQLSRSTRGLEDAFARLSSGLRINRASDDAAGLAVSSALSVDRRVLNQGVRNLSDGISLLSIADGAFSELSGITTRLSELAEQAANGTLGSSQRAALDEEAQSLKDEYFRIVKTVSFNGVKLFDSGFGELRLQSGYGADGGIVGNLGGAIGSGSFGASSSFAGNGDQGFSLSLGDLNNDGFLDMAMHGASGAGLGVTNIRLGNGDGTFRTAVSLSVLGLTNEEGALEDINNDGILDLILAGQMAGGRFVATRLGNGDGTFRAVVSYNESHISQIMGLEVADMNNDGNLDIVTSGGGGPGTVSLRFGAGDGTFGSPVSSSLSIAVSHTAIGDLNGDGLLDLVSAGNAVSGVAFVRLGAGGGTFGAAISYTTEASASSAVVLADANGDDILDMITAGYAGADGYATIRLGSGTGTFGAARSFAAESGYTASVSLADVNGDGAGDLITAGRQDGTGGFATVRLGDGTGGFSAAVSFVTHETHTSNVVRLGDLNSDGALDLVTTGNDTSFDGIASVRLNLTETGVAPLLEFSLATLADARQALPVFKAKLDTLAAQRGTIGALQTRVGAAMNTTTVAAENYAAAASQITDADIADESARLVRQRILQQAGAAILAQANQGPALALSLL